MPDSLFSTATVTIAAGQTVSTSFAMGEAYGIERIEMPADWTVAESAEAPAAFITFLGGQDTTTFRKVHFEDQEAQVPVVAGRSIACYPPVSGLKHVKIVASVVQAAPRTITVVLRNPPPPTEVNVTVSSPPV
jgi:hypothetical protein